MVLPVYLQVTENERVRKICLWTRLVDKHISTAN